MMRRLIFAAAVLLAFGAGAQTKIHYFMQRPSDVASAIPYGANDAAGGYADAGDARIYYEVYGEGAPVLVLHGGGVGSTYEMGRLIDSLSVCRKVIAVSTRGHGRSEIGTVPVSYEQRANDALAALSAVTDEPAVVVGFSDGAYTAYELASLYPERVERVVAIGAGENLRQLRRIVPSTVEELRRVDPVFMAEQMALMPEPERLQEYWNDFYAFYNRQEMTKPLFNSIKCPVLLMAGERDPNAPLDTVLAAYRMIPDCELAIIAGAPHQAMVANFDAVWANIRPFLEKPIINQLNK